MRRLHRKGMLQTFPHRLHRFDRRGSDVVQLRAGWADSVLLCWGSSVAYEDSGLDPDLIAQLNAWDTRYREQLRADGELPPTVRDAHRHEGLRLADQLADALGRRFAVEFDEQVTRSRHQAATPAAATAFRAHRHQREAELRAVVSALSRGSTRDDDAATPDHRSATQPGQWLREVRAGTTRPVRVLLSPDLAVGFPVEVVVDGQAGYVSGEMLGISDGLTKDLESFQEQWEQDAWDDGDDEEEDDADAVAGDDPEWAEWRQQRDRLVERLQLELGDAYHVTGV